MSLSTLLEAAKYLDYLDSNNHSGGQQSPLQQNNQTNRLHRFQQQSHATSVRKTTRRRSSKKDAANTMLAMSLPASTGPMQMQGVPIPMAGSTSAGQHYQAASLSSSFTTGSPLSSFASTALLCSKASGVTSASSSAASSLSSSDSSSSCGEILMGESDFIQPAASSSSKSGGKKKNKLQAGQQNSNASHHNYHLTHQHFETNHQIANQLNQMHKFNSSNNNNNQFSDNNNQSIARYIAATSSGPQLVTMTTSPTFTSTSAPIDGRLRAGHVVHASANNGQAVLSAAGAGFDSRHFSIANGMHDGQTFSLAATNSLAKDHHPHHHLSGSPGSCPPLIMARVQPMILNSLSPSAQGIMAFQHQHQQHTTVTASSPTSSSSSYSRHRELHKTLEKNRRTHLRHCFELLKAELPASECVDKKTSHINIIKSAIRYVLALRQQECEIDNELQRLTKIKTDLTEKLSTLRATEQQPNAGLQIQEVKVEQLQQQQQQVISDQRLSSSSSTSESPQEQHQQPSTSTLSSQQPVAEQQLSLLLSQSKID